MNDITDLQKGKPAQALLPGVEKSPATGTELRARAASRASAEARRTRLSARQRLFVETYLQSLNASDAARRAGYADPESNSLRILHAPAVQAALAERMDERRARCPQLGERVIEELCRIAFADPRELLRWGPDGVELRPSDELTPAEAASVAEIAEGRGGLRLKKHDKLKALELLGRHLGMFSDRVQAEISGPGGSPLREDKRILVQFVGKEE